jgi:hypothetical protein
MERAVARPAGRLVRIGGFAIALGLAGATNAPSAAHGQNLLDFLRGLLGGQQRPGPPLMLDGFFRGEWRDIPDDTRGPRVAYCVRLCDGRYFPLPTNAGAPSSSPKELCRAMCPAAETRIFTGSGIGRAVSADGKPYRDLQHAFAHRDRLVADCTCNGVDTTGVARVDILADPTLRPGDIVVTENGPVVFKGNRKAPHATSDFVPAEDDKRLSKGLRNTLSQMQIAPESGPANVRSEIPPDDAAPALGFVQERSSAIGGFRPLD